MKGIRCLEARKISAYLDGELDPSASQSVRRHIEQCESCRETAADFQQVDAMVDGLPLVEPGPAFLGELLGKAGRVVPAERRHWKPQPISSAIRFAFRFMDLLTEGKSPSTDTLDEFRDFPPCSIGAVYLKLLDDQPVRR